MGLIKLMIKKNIVILVVLILTMAVLGGICLYYYNQGFLQNSENKDEADKEIVISESSIKALENADLDIQYKTIEGVDPSFLTLDVYPVKDIKNAPVVVFVHGGGWTSGDKAKVYQGPESFLDFFQRNKTVFVAINYRLLFSDKAPGAIYADQETDIASAVKWVHDNISLYGGDPENISLFGYSAGAQMVSLVGTDEAYLKAEGLSLNNIKKVIAFDVDAYDIPRAIVEGVDYNYPYAEGELTKFFSFDLETQKAASSINHLFSSKKYPEFLVVYSGAIISKKGKTTWQELSKRQAELFVEAILRVGGKASLYGDLNMTHTELGLNFGIMDFGPTIEVQKFLYNK